MEDWQKHVARINDLSLNQTMSWCNEELYSHVWYFTSIDHAANSARSRLQACPKCMEMIIKALHQEES